MNAFEKAIKHFGSQRKMAKALNTVPGTITVWKQRGIPLVRAVEIEIATGGVITRQQLLPEYFGDIKDNWSDLEQSLVWEIAEKTKQLKSVRALRENTLREREFTANQLQLAV